MDMLRIYAPATSANINVGFDSLGVALSPIDGTLLGDIVQVETASQPFTFDCVGHFVKDLPQEPHKNIVYQAYVLFNERLKLQGNKPRPLRLTLEKNMPIGSGLGSSACSIVATLVGLNTFHSEPFNRTELLSMMGELEGRISGSIHYDNVAPCYLGGMQLMLQTGNTICQSLPYFTDWYWILAYSGIEVPTAQARAILPPNYPRQTLIEQARNLGGFIHACHTNQTKLAANLLQDLIAEPYRQQLLPQFLQVKQGCQDLGGLSSGISGSGPTMFAIADNLTTANKIAHYLHQNYLQNSQGFVHICQVDNQGAKMLA
ncbi:homoserine kinase [Mergibacter septicus]|uniref:Homoserine kinase n=1 Tax=Mergibacter septicus TaxID=221402 RepID=A0A8D4LMT8_9PAST|nr:homoserine kinase [Mergibacter septicus]AWX14763.1 homoserine kinase [Mergibacter septicus]QDJ14014.1 homoserine kinase [Mergibacter septicus]UTU48537.1 homoserine kinase [Mergibacter septicus]WMR95834.1 homoserine kinase [Mergibacter septicus]